MQTYARVAWPSSITRTRCRFGLKRRFVATMEWLRLLPKPGFFPQMAQTFDISGRAWYRSSPTLCCSCGEALFVGARLASPCSASGGRAKVREQIGHLERAANGLRALSDARLRLLDAVERENAEGDGHAGLERREL